MIHVGIIPVVVEITPVADVMESRVVDMILEILRAIEVPLTTRAPIMTVGHCPMLLQVFPLVEPSITARAAVGHDAAIATGIGRAREG